MDEGKKPGKLEPVKLEAVTAEVLMEPSESQLLAKSRFWRKMAENPLFDADKVTAAKVEQLTGSSQIKKWWGDPMFRDWFLDKDFVYHGLQMLAEKGIKALYEILDDPKTSAKEKGLAAIKALELAGYKPAARREVKWADKGIGDMDANQLREFIAKNTKDVTPNE